ncbi:MAG: hypothetical protein ACHP78_03860 [Terriglobales bacterium]
MKDYIPARRNEGGPKRSKVFSYFTEKERERLDVASEKAKESLSRYVANAALAQADRDLGPVPVPEPLSLERIVQALKRGTKQSEIEALIQDNGISFDPKQALKSLEGAGAGVKLLLEIYKAARHFSKES